MRFRRYTAFLTARRYSRCRTCISGLTLWEAGLLENSALPGADPARVGRAVCKIIKTGMEGRVFRRAARTAFTDQRRARGVDRAAGAAGGQPARAATGAAFARAIYSIWSRLTPAPFAGLCRRDGGGGCAAFSFDLSAQVWDAVIGLLDVFGGALAGISLPLAV